MRSEQVIKELIEKLEKLTGFISEHGNGGEFLNKDVRFSCNACDALSWVLGEIPTDRFTSDTHLNLFRLEHIARAIEKRTGKKLADYK